MIFSVVKKITPLYMRIYLRKKFPVFNEYLIKKKYKTFGFNSLRDRQIIKLLSTREKSSILLSGFQKSGNTWARFIIFNYWNILLNDAHETLTFDELNRIQYQFIEKEIRPFKEGFPPFCSTHLPYYKLFDNFDKVIYLFRDPLDTLISLYYYLRDRVVPFNSYPEGLRAKLHDINYFILHELPSWIMHYVLSANKSGFLLCYENIKQDPFDEFVSLFRFLEFEIDYNALKKSIALSSLESIRAMAKKTGRIHGMADPKRFKGKFLRNGTVKQYEAELDKHVIKRAKQILKGHGFNL